VRGVRAIPVHGLGLNRKRKGKKRRWLQELEGMQKEVAGAQAAGSHLQSWGRLGPATCGAGFSGGKREHGV
jgi:hypothetical protein